MCISYRLRVCWWWCSDVASELVSKRDARHIVLNPVIGPEPVTGSSRMKGGSTTKIMLETIFADAMTRVFGASLAVTSPPNAASLNAAAFPRVSILPGLISLFEATHRHTYYQSESIAGLVECGVHSLRCGGHIYYLGDGDGAVMAFIDASEMPDTFGTPHTDVRAFVTGGWNTMQNANGDLTNHSKLFRISIQHFESDVLSTYVLISSHSFKSVRCVLY